MGFILASPDRYGRFAHQSASILSGILISHITGHKMLLPRYMYFCDKWNPYVNWSKSQYVASSMDKLSHADIQYLESSTSDGVGNRKWDLSKSKNLLEMLSRLVTFDYDSIIALPFDQQPGILFKLLNKPDVLDDYRSIFCFPESSQVSDPYLCIHIRRGDCNQEHHPTWFIRDEIYVALLLYLISKLPSDFRIVICTQGSVDWIARGIGSRNMQRIILNTTKDEFINDSEISDFITMLNSDYFIGSQSGYSYWAAILGSQTFSCSISRLPHFMSNIPTINPDTRIEDFIASIKNLVIKKIWIDGGL